MISESNFKEKTDVALISSVKDIKEYMTAMDWDRLRKETEKICGGSYEVLYNPTKTGDEIGYFQEQKGKSNHSIDMLSVISDCFDAIIDSDIVIALVFNHHLGVGVLYEIEYARSFSKPIYLIEISTTKSKDDEPHDMRHTLISLDRRYYSHFKHIMMDYMLSTEVKVPEEITQDQLDDIVSSGPIEYIHSVLLNFTSTFSQSAGCMYTALRILEDKELKGSKFKIALDTHKKVETDINDGTKITIMRFNIVHADPKVVSALMYIVDDFRRELSVDTNIIRWKNQGIIKRIIMDDGDTGAIEVHF